jgi:hypothetical protein
MTQNPPAFPPERRAAQIEELKARIKAIGEQQLTPEREAELEALKAQLRTAQLASLEAFKARIRAQQGQPLTPKREAQIERIKWQTKANQAKHREETLRRWGDEPTWNDQELREQCLVYVLDPSEFERRPPDARMIYYLMRRFVDETPPRKLSSAQIVRWLADLEAAGRSPGERRKCVAKSAGKTVDAVARMDQRRKKGGDR